MEKIRGIKKVVSIGPDELGESDLSLTYNAPYVGKVEADIFIYSYYIDGYEGSGVGVWRKNGKWSYQYLGHCSCNGPTENIRTSDAAKFTLQELKDILTSEDNSWNTHYRKMANYLSRFKF